MKDDILSINTLYRNVVYVTETSSKKASTVSQKWLTSFGQKAQNFVISYHTILFKFHQYNGNIKCPIGKSIFAVNLPFNLFPYTVANGDTIWYVYTLTTCWQNLNQIVWFKMYKSWSFVANTKFFKTIFDKALTSFCKTFL